MHVVIVGRWSGLEGLIFRGIEFIMLGNRHGIIYPVTPTFPQTFLHPNNPSPLLDKTPPITSILHIIATFPYNNNSIILSILILTFVPISSIGAIKRISKPLRILFLQFLRVCCMVSLPTTI